MAAPVWRVEFDRAAVRGLRKLGVDGASGQRGDSKCARRTLALNRARRRAIEHAVRRREVDDLGILADIAAEPEAGFFG